MSATRFIKEVIVSSGTAKVVVDDIFSSNFEIYHITFTNFKGTNGSYSDFRFIYENGNEANNTQYDNIKTQIKSYQAPNQNSTTNQDHIPDILNLYSYTTAQGGSNCSGQLWVFNPYNSDRYTQVMGQGALMNTNNNLIGTQERCIFTETSKVTGFVLFRASGSDAYESLNIRVYGIGG